MAEQSNIYQLKATVRDIRPPIWRRVLVPGDLTLSQFHAVMLVLFGWHGGHLHMFTIGETRYESAPEHDDFGPPARDESAFRLAQVAPAAGRKFNYEYDFGDSWEVDVLVERVLPAEGADAAPVVKKGARMGPPDDVGGVPGYYDFIKTMADPSDPDHEEMAEWYGGAFDPEEFDLDAINGTLARMKAAPRSRRRSGPMTGR